MQWLYKRFDGTSWVKPSKVLSRADRELLYAHVSEHSLSVLRRMIFLKDIGATMGSSWFLCALFLFVKFFLSKTCLSLQESELLSIAIGLTILSLGLLGLGRVKSEQQKLFMFELYEEVKKKLISKDSANQSHGPSSKKVEGPPSLAIED